MKTFEGKLHLWCVVIVFIATLLLAVGRVAAETDPIPNIYLNFSKTSYGLDSSENIKAYITITNTAYGSDIWTNKGFSDLDYRLFFFIQGPDGKMISFSGLAGVSPTPSLPPGRVSVEKLDKGWVRYMEILDLGDLFALNQPGTYTAWVSMPFISHNPDKVKLDDSGGYFVSGEAEPLWPIQGGIKSNIESEKMSFVLTTASAVGTYDIRVLCRQFIFGEGSRPGVTKYPLGGISVRLYKMSYIEAQGIGPINYKTCNEIVQLPDFKVAKEVINSPGEYLFSNVETDDYVVIGYGTGATDYKHLWGSISADDTDWDNGGILVDLILMTDIRDKKKPAKTQKVKGSELLIVAPDYVEWTSSQELYPFAFESDGEWSVEVVIQPPEGFVSNYGSLSEIISSELKAIQFTVTDVGSKWVPTSVEYNIKHKNKKQKIKSEIDVKLSHKLSKKKKVNIYGEDDQGKDKKK
jgi:hypothetical protein